MSFRNEWVVEVVVIGGGIAGLWLLDELTRSGRSAILLEKQDLGSGQTIASQGIIHGGLKYMLDGNLTLSAKVISEMPALWRDCVAGRREPNLGGTQVLSEYGCIWGTGSIKSRIFMMGSSIALRTAPVPMDRHEWPAALANVPGKVLKVGEQVLDPSSLMATFAARNRGRLMKIENATFERSGDQVQSVAATVTGGSVLIRTEMVVLTAGQGNGDMRQKAGLSATAMQRRPLHMVMVRGDLPELFGHCVAGPKPRVTITSATDSAGHRIWQVGGQIAEDGVAMDSTGLISHARKELAASVPGLKMDGLEYATYRVDRAEAATAAGHRPDDVHLVREGNVITAWPTKLALAPRLADRVLEEIDRGLGQRSASPGSIEVPAELHPTVAQAPWEEAEWTIAH